MSMLAGLWVEWVLMGSVFVLLLALLRARMRNRPPARGEGRARSPRSLLGWTAYGLRLLGFALAAFLLVSLAIMVYRNWMLMENDTAPAPSRVMVPADLPFEVQAVTFPSEDGVRISGWYVPSQNGALVILLHGYGGNRTAMLWHAERLVEAGYGALLYDERASGESEGAHRSYGWEDPRDVGGALAFLDGKSELDPGRIGIAGCSIGGQIALQGAAYYPRIGAVWADGPSTVRAQDISRPTNPIFALLVAANYMGDWMLELRLGTPAPAPMVEIIGGIAPRPIMLVGGGRPRPFVGSEGDHLPFFQEHAGENAQLWVIPEAYHCDGPAVRPDEYAARLVAFFDSAFGIQRR